MKDVQPSVPLIEALSAAWSAICAHHPDVPSVVLLPAPAARGRQVLGHFAALRWSAKERQEGHLHEVVVVAEHLNREASDVFETLLHEAAHAMNFARDIKDCSTTSQYHNKAFALAAGELGLTVEKVPHYGFAYTRLRPETLERYAEVITELDRVLLHRRSATRVPMIVPADSNDPDPQDADTEDGEGSSSRSRKAVCDCAFIIRVSKKTMNETTIVCETCGSAFRFD